MLQQLESIYLGNGLDFEQSNESFRKILQGKVDSTLLTAILVALKTKGESVDEIAGAASALRQQAVAFPQAEYSISDCCGTGGDGLDTINVSTIVSLVAAAAGVKIVKHGNRSVSSKCGSADLMEQLGVNIHLSPSQSKRLLDEVNFSFLFAPDYHKGVRHAMSVRQSLKTRTIFNLIGPLANPAIPDIQLLGVYDKKYCRPFAEILNRLGTHKALIVNGSGLDEIAIHDVTHAAYLNNGVIEEILINPEDIGIKKYSLESIQADTIEDNTLAAIKVLQGNSSEAHIDMVAINCGALLFLNDLAEDISCGVKLAKELLVSGRAYQHLENIKNASLKVVSNEGVING